MSPKNGGDLCAHRAGGAERKDGRTTEIRQGWADFANLHLLSVKVEIFYRFVIVSFLVARHL